MLSVKLVGLLKNDKLLAVDVEDMISKIASRTPKNSEIIVKLIKLDSRGSIYKASVALRMFGKYFFYQESGNIAQLIFSKLTNTILLALKKQTDMVKQHRRNSKFNKEDPKVSLGTEKTNETEYGFDNLIELEIQEPNEMKPRKIAYT